MGGAAGAPSPQPAEGLHEPARLLGSAAADRAGFRAPPADHYANIPAVPDPARKITKAAAGRGADWIVLRYADVLLMRAGAILAGRAQTGNADALAAVNAVRQRAGLDSLTGTQTGRAHV